LGEAVGFFHQLTDTAGVIQVLEEMAELANGLALWDRTLRLAGAALNQRRIAGLAPSESARAKSERSVQTARHALETGQAAKAWMEGAKMSLQETIDYAQANASSGAS